MTESSDMSSDEFDENVHESDGLSFDENDFESAELSSRDGADHGNGVFLKLEDVSISTANSGSGAVQVGGGAVVDSWDIYSRYARVYDLVRLSGLKRQLLHSDVLDVRFYSLCSDDVGALSEALTENARVTAFDLAGTELDAAACRHLSELLRKNRVIKRLNASRCRMDAAGAIELARSLAKSALESLDLSDNRIDCVGVRSVLEALQANEHVKELNLSNNGVRNECVPDLTAFVDINDTLETLNLSGNFLNRESVLTPFARTLGVSNQNLQVLILRWNGLSGKECANVFKNLIARTEGLKVLDISWNNFSDVGKILGQGIKKATALEHLDISNNPLTAEDVVDLLNSVVLPTSLKSLGITHVFVDEQLEKTILKAQSRVPTFSVGVGLYTGIKTGPVDLQTLFLRRIHFLGVKKPKKKTGRIDIGRTLLKMKTEGNAEPVTKTLFLSTFQKLKIKDGVDAIEELAKAFQNSKKKVDVALMLQKYLLLFPGTE